MLKALIPSSYSAAALTLVGALASADPARLPPSLSESQKAYWGLLLHESPSRPGRSEVDSPEFFLSPKGKSDFQEELRATLEFLKKPSAFRMGKIPQHPQCLFPERTRFLREIFHEAGIDPLFPTVSCPEFQDWKSRFNPVDLYLIYAAPYLGSPASMFGHTFLKMKSHHAVAPLDYAISFEASAGEAGGIVYALYGLTGMYPGVFNVLPYHMKIQQYSAMESRDLWEYKIPASKDGVGRMLNHLWEMGPQYMLYYFFDENCSYHLLSLIEVASQAPGTLRKGFRWMAIPSDTLAAALPNPTEFALRPSLSNILKARLSALSPSDRNLAVRLTKSPSEANATTSAGVLDAVLDGIRLKRTSRSDKIYYTSDQTESFLLGLRAKQPVTLQPATLIQSAPWPKGSSPPHQGHSTSKFGIGTGTETADGNSVRFIDFKFRSAIHDEIDPSDGHLRFSSLAIGSISARLRRENQRAAIFLNELTLAEVKSFGPPPTLGFPSVWHVSGGFAQPLDLQCRECGVARIRGGWGLGTQLGLDDWNLMAIANVNLEGGTLWKSAVRIAPGFQLLGLLDTPKLRASASAEVYRNLTPMSDNAMSAESSHAELLLLTEVKASLFHFRAWDLRVNFQHLQSAESRGYWRSQTALELHRFY